MKRYRVIKEIQYEVMDEDCCGTGEYETIKKGALYYHDPSTDCLSSCEIRLEAVGDYGWLDCYKKDLEECFEEII